MGKMLAICLIIVAMLPNLQQAKAEAQEKALQKLKIKSAMRKVDAAKMVHPMRIGCTGYVYGCGYGTVPGYGSMPGYGDRPK